MSVCACDRPSVTDVTSLPQRILWEWGYKVYYNAYSGNESPNCCSAWPTWSSLSRHSHSYRRATKAGQATLGQAKTVLSTSRILSQATKVLGWGISVLIFLERQTVLQWPTWSSSSRHILSYRRATMTGQTTLEQTKTVVLTSRILSQVGGTCS